MKQHEISLNAMIKYEEAIVMICGNTKMGQDVQTLLKEMLGEKKFNEIEKSGRIVKELWSS